MAKYNKLEGKHVVVIGGTRGIGRAVAEAAIESGAKVTISGSSPQSAAAALGQIQAAYPEAAVHALGCDLSRETVEADLDGLLTQAEQRAPIDHIVYTAADSLTLGALDTLTLPQMRQAAHMRLFVPLTVGKLAGRHLAKSRFTSLTLTTGSIAQKPTPDWSLIAYFAAGLEGLTRNLAMDLKPIRVNVVEPGLVDTELWGGSLDVAAVEKNAFLNHVATVDEVAEAYMWLLRDSNATGEIACTRGGSHLA